MSVTPSGGSSEWVSPATIHNLLLLIDSRVGELPLEDDQRQDHFTGTDEAGEEYSIDLHQIPLERSLTGAIALIHTAQLENGMPLDDTETFFYFLPELSTGDIRLQRYMELSTEEAPEAQLDTLDLAIETNQETEDGDDDDEFEDEDSGDHEWEDEEDATDEHPVSITPPLTAAQSRGRARRLAMLEEHAAGFGKVLEIDAQRLYKMVAAAKRYETEDRLPFFQRILRRLFGLEDY